jgi:hypothetical protein
MAEHKFRSSPGGQVTARFLKIARLKGENTLKRIVLVIIALFLVGVFAVPRLRTSAANPAPASHPEYKSAVEDLRSARKHLSKALADGYGHRDAAMRAIDRAISECNQAAGVLH